MRFIFTLILSVLICGCEMPTIYSPSEKENLANELTKKVAIEMKNKYGLIPCGTGGQINDQIKMLALSFDYREQLDIETGRKLLISAVETFRAEINSDVRIRPFLSNYPFEPKNIEIRIFIQRRDGSNFGSDKLSVISALEGVLKYKIDTPDGNGLITIHQESYEESLQKLDKTEQTAA